MSSTNGKHTAIDDVRDALASSLRLREVVRAVQPPLARLLGGDHTAFGFLPGDAGGGITPGAPQESGRIEWMASEDLPRAFFGDYERLAAHDFVLRAVAACPRKVLLDSDLVSRAELEANPFHLRARELGVPLRHVMAVMLDVGGAPGGLAVYREGERPFGERERALLQLLIPALTQAVRNCQRFEAAERRAHVLEQVLAGRDRALMVFDSRARELFRTERSTSLLERWFTGARERPALPDPLPRHVKRWLARDGDTTPSTFSRGDSESMLVVTPEWISDAHRVLLALVLEERPRPPGSSAAWARLTPRQRDVVAGVVRGWDNQLIATELGCALPTVKTHLTQIYDKVGVSTRSQLMAAALAMGWGARPSHE